MGRVATEGGREHPIHHQRDCECKTDVGTCQIGKMGSAVDNLSGDEGKRARPPSRWTWGCGDDASISGERKSGKHRPSFLTSSAGGRPRAKSPVSPRPPYCTGDEPVSALWIAGG